tara:strand:- start:211 stop:423 length:213 start_codon:yes stop_codon:yes gene_type:complete
MLTKLEYDEAGILLDIGEFGVYLNLKPAELPYGDKTVLSVNIGVVNPNGRVSVSNLTVDECIRFTVAKEG